VSASDSAVSISENGFAMLFGGGVDVKATKIVAVRLIQADWLYYHFGSNTIAGVTVPSFSQSNNVRISTGIVFRF
jgi:opacity protein-like surface antigen